MPEEKKTRQVVKYEGDDNTLEPRRKKASGPKSSDTRSKNSDIPASSKLIHQFIPYIIVLLAIFISACFIFNKNGGVGVVGKVLNDFFCGLFGWPAFILPLILLNLAIYWRKYVERSMVAWKLILGFVCLVSVSALVHSFHVNSVEGYDLHYWSGTVFGTNGATAVWTDGIGLSGGGFFGGLVGGFIRALCGYVGSPIIIIALITISAMFYFSVTPGYVVTSLRLFFIKIRERIRQRKEAALEKEEQKRLEMEKDFEKRRREEEKRRREEEKRKPKQVFDAPVIVDGTGNKSEEVKDIVGTSGSQDTPSTDIIITTAEIAPAPTPVPAEPKPDSNMTAAEVLEKVFGKRIPEKDGYDIPENAGESAAVHPAPSAPIPPAAPPAVEPVVTTPIKMSKITDTGIPEDDTAYESDTDSAHREKEQLEAYLFPPTELLDEVVSASKDDITSELRGNAQKIMDKLNAFSVKIKKIEYSRGPSITRYELYPDASTRVRSISSLQDDIALELAALIRMESPIPNKNAVGIEVPNQVREIVYIREMIESEKFRSLGSRLSACLGKDIGGNMVFFDIAKMPHLLIAGTTGSGKSVCLNTIILSILYKSRPDEVKFIMIDPKKIELGVYNGLPHMKVPVVTDMKRAAGTLNAAVNEMEHRYSSFEETGCRDLDGYNSHMLKRDPDFIPVPRIVIIIDELADLMMTAPQDIEGSIIRLAQKARAAGIHLIVGTQRPSANVITGLIKSNIPSRIAFSVASGTDSRIIIDQIGAEKLIGKGDMLFSPVGSQKASRIQGAYVDDEEVRAVTDFIRENSNGVVYDENFLSDIERETDRLEAENNHSKQSEDDEDNEGEYVQEADALFNKALHIAVENGSIATSLLQRKLGVGFGRGAKIIDRMEALGFVSGPNGTKPRQVRLTTDQLREMELGNDPRAQGKFV